MIFLAALRFLTSVPVPGVRETGPDKMGRATAYFPLVGLIIGLVLAALNWLLGFILPQPVVNVLLLLALVIITGALHLDGLADTCDGIAVNKPVEERWRVMRDSHAGAFGIVGIALVILVKYVSLNNIPASMMAAALVFMPVVSRWAMVYVIFAHCYARPEGLGAAFKQATRWPQFVVATLITVAVALALFPWLSLAGVMVLCGVWVIVAPFALYLKHKFAGLTGDTYGAINEVAEAAALLLVILVYTVAVNLG